MAPRVPPATILALGATLALLLLSCSDAFGPLFEACAPAMESVRSSYPGAPTREQRITRPDGRRIVIWDLPVPPGPAPVPTEVAFIWSPSAPHVCSVCWPGDPRCWPLGQPEPGAAPAAAWLPNQRLKLAARVD